MISYIFSFTNNVDFSSFTSLISFDENHSEYFNVVLSNEREFEQLLDLLGIDKYSRIELTDSEDFDVLYELSSRLPVWEQEEFDNFYDVWLKASQRDNNIDEYGQLIFIQEHAKKRNESNKRIILRERLQ